MPLPAGNGSRAANGLGSVCGGFWARLLGRGWGEKSWRKKRIGTPMSVYFPGLTVYLSPTCLPIIPTMAADATGMRRTRVLVTTW